MEALAWSGSRLFSAGVVFMDFYCLFLVVGAAEPNTENCSGLYADVTEWDIDAAQPKVCLTEWGGGVDRVIIHTLWDVLVCPSL